MFKYEIGQLVYKPKGYKFIGRVVGRYEVDGGIRYDVQVDGNHAVATLHYLMREGSVTIPRATTLILVEHMLKNCHGMIHIFSEEQLAPYTQVTNNGTA